jgi:hypothetical protein
MSIQVVCMEHFPAQIFRDKNGPVAVLYAQKVLAGATANQSIIAAVTGKVIRVLTMYMVSDGALITTGNLLDGSGGTTKFAIATPPNTVSPCPPFQFNPAGWVETSSGVGLYGTIGPATGLIFSCSYIAYTP